MLLKKMKNHHYPFPVLIILVGPSVLIGLLAILFAYSGEIGVLGPKGLIALQERDLMLLSTALMLLVVVPVFVMTGMFMWKYRAENTEATYHPDWDYSLAVEVIWWGIPCVIVLILSVAAWITSHELDPFKPLEGFEKPPLKIQVVALQWKWLFIYPEQGIATVNALPIPVDTPLAFELTAEAPMNSFWIPRLGGQIYAMPGMKTKLHLIANEPGEFRGVSANLSGEGFAGMTFIATAMDEAKFENWVQTVKQSSEALDAETYRRLAEPSAYVPPAFFVLQQGDLFERIFMQYMHAPQNSEH